MILFWSWTAVISAALVFPEASNPYNSVIRPRGRPPTPVIQSIAMLPVGRPMTSGGLPMVSPCLVSNSARSWSNVLGMEFLLADFAGAVTRCAGDVEGAVFCFRVDGPGGDQIGGAVVALHFLRPGSAAVSFCA